VRLSPFFSLIFHLAGQGFGNCRKIYPSEYKEQGRRILGSVGINFLLLLFLALLFG
jgi:hypothetical protein